MSQTTLINNQGFLYELSAHSSSLIHFVCFFILNYVPGWGVRVSESALRGQKLLDPLGLELVSCEPPGMCLKNQTKSSAGAVLALNYL